MLANYFASIIVSADRIIHPAHYRPLSLWKYLDVPHRPNKKEVALYEKLLGKLSPDDRVLILGATPELRDLVLRLGAAPFVADVSAHMLNAMQPLMIENSERRETLIQKNWLDLDFPDNFFSAIVGDLSFRHLEPASQSVLLEKMRRWLRPNAKAVFRVHAVNPEYQGNYPAILDEMKKNYDTYGVLTAMSILLSQLYDASTRDQMIDRKGIERGVRDYLSKTNIPFSYRVFLHEFLAKRIELFSKPLSSQTKDELEEIFKMHCAIRQIYKKADYPEAPHYPIYHLQPLK